MRIGDSFGLEVEDFIIDDTLHVRRAIWNGIAFSPKTEAGFRMVDLSPELSKALRRFIGDRLSGYIFRNERGRPLQQSNLLQRSLHPILKTIGIKQQGFHGFRRFRVTHLRKQRVAEDLIRLWIGHSSGQTTTDGYVRIADDEQFRQFSVEQAGIGFQLTIALLAPRWSPQFGDP